MKAFGVFEGGGVRGYAHLGALKACEDRDIEFVGVSGTSIGAIVAALVAAGYTSSELFDVDDRGRESGLFAVDVIEAFLDPVEYGRLKRLRGWHERISDAGKRVREKWHSARARFGADKVSRLIPSRISSLWRRGLRSLEFASLSLPPIYATAMPLAAFHWRLLRTVYSRSGILDSTRFTSWLNERLCERLRLEPGATATFADLPVPLACIATNLSTGSMAVFDKSANPDMSVAEAAMASACYPLVFKPRRIGEHAFVDGGIVSNFPAWTLDGERAGRDRILPTFGFRVINDEVDGTRPWPGDGEPGLIDVTGRIVAAAMWGRGDLESRRIDDLHPMRVKTPIKSTDFHSIMEKRIELFNAGRNRVQDYFSSHLGPRDPDDMEARLRRICDVVRACASASGLVRAYLIQPTEAEFARVVYSALYEGDADDMLTLRRGSATQILCLERREPILLRVADLDEASRQAPGTKLVHALRPTNVTHAYCIPLFASADEWSKPDPSNRDEPVAAVCFDFDQADDRLLLEPDVENTLASIGDALVDLWMDRMGPGLRVLAADEEQAPSADWVALPEAGFYASARKVRCAADQEWMEWIGRTTR